MRKLFISTLLLACFSCNNTAKFYDGEGNEIPIKKALVENNVIKPDAEYFAIIND